MGTQKDSEKTKARILDAAGPLFAAKGFKEVTVREIAAAAETQISALNYHFRSKDELYREVVITACVADLMTEKQKAMLKTVKPEKALQLIIEGAEKEYRVQDANHWHNTLLAHESRDPSPAFAEASKVYYKPQTDFMAELVGHVVGKPADDMQVRLAVVILWSLFDVFFEYSQLVDVVAPGLSDYLAKKNKLSGGLYDLVIHIAGKPEA